MTRSTTPETVAISTPSKDRTVVPWPRRKPTSAGISSPGVTTGMVERGRLVCDGVEKWKCDGDASDSAKSIFLTPIDHAREAQPAHFL